MSGPAGKAAGVVEPLQALQQREAGKGFQLLVAYPVTESAWSAGIALVRAGHSASNIRGRVRNYSGWS